MPSPTIIQIIVLCNVAIYVNLLATGGAIRAKWTWNKNEVRSIYDYIDYSDDLTVLCRANYTTFEYIANKMNRYLQWPRKWNDKVGIDATYYPYKLGSYALGPKDRLLRYYMNASRYPVVALVEVFKQKKSVVYEDFKFIDKMIVKVLGDEWLSLPDAHSQEYEDLIGAGVFSENDRIVFNNCPYIVDVTPIQIVRPKDAQKSYFNGKDKRHTADFHTVHSGTGRVYNVTGPQPGARNDIQIAKKCPLYTNKDHYLLPGHGVLADLIYYYIGEPYFCKFCYQQAYTQRQKQLNTAHAKSRVISENWYCRFKVYWQVMATPYHRKLEDIGITFRALAITTNIIITLQAPLRKGF